MWDARTGEPVSPLLQHDEESRRMRATFSADGRQVVTLGRDDALFGEESGLGRDNVRVWEVSGDERSVADWVALARLLSGHEIDAGGGLQPLSAEKLQLLWTDLRAKYPQDFTVTPAEARAWREEQIGQCLKEGNLDGAFFHYHWLISEMVTAAGK
jgi:hypothetical protein